MRRIRPLRKFLLGLMLYVGLCGVGGIFLADGALHPERRPLTEAAIEGMRRMTISEDASFEDVSVAAADGVRLRGWLARPRSGNGSAVILLHGLADNRSGMTGYSQLLLAHGFSVLMPDARAQGSSEGLVATYGLLERNDIRRWVEYLRADEPRCVFGFGESMGAAQLLQSLEAGAPFCAVAAESSFANFREIAYDRMGQPFHLGPWVGRVLLRPMVEAAFLRARWKYGLHMENISPEDAAQQTAVPILLIHGESDRNIPVRHSRRIHQSDARSVLWEVAGADHCGAISVAPKEFEQKLLAWFHAPAAQ
ncbi:MAG TPA: alpha/beta fold hydrolase [Candidatus Sulfotelmatobacter sp.]|nr:alpha/beta fold hydrolase [Candidatus Sulfotelmatobacter sp.]